MSLEDILRSLNCFDDLPLLLSCLGHHGPWEALPVGAVSGAGSHVRQASNAMDGSGFSWVLLETDEPGQAARAAAKRLAVAGRTVAVVALDPAGRRLAVAAAAASAAMVELRLDAPDPVALAILRRLERGNESALGYLIRITGALDGEGIGREFFRRFRDTLEGGIAALPHRIPAEERHALALMQLTRVLLLYFVQSKGWLDGRRDFLVRAVDECLTRRRSVQKHLLRPLFFGTLNRPPAERSGPAAAFGRIPFLNGGLFEPHRLERRWPVDLPTPFWRDAFDLLFERFHFTVSEGRAASQVAPDMLGRVFEGVMDPQHRRETGTFYTPASLVARMVDAALAAAVAARHGWHDGPAHARLLAADPEALATLRHITILDPAAGSGAFLLGALDRLAFLRSRGIPRGASLKREILGANLFGVDRNAMAVRLTELRLWLAVVAEEPDGPNTTVEPLPNLACLIRQGDSLSAPIIAGAPARDANIIGTLRRRAIGASGMAKLDLSRRLADAEAAAAATALAAAESRSDAAIAEFLAAARAPTLFGTRTRLSADERRALGKLRAARRAIRAGRRRLAREGELPWFHYESHFADVFARGGFDIVIGNPPWVRGEALPLAVRERLAERYRWWHGGGRGFAHRPDLAVAFLERAHELAAPSGVIALLLPAKLTSAGYASVARAALVRETRLHAVVDLAADPDAVFDATIYPLALIASKRAPTAAHAVRTRLEPEAPASVPQISLDGAPWILRHAGAAAVGRRLAALHPPLADRFIVYLGVKTGADAVFLDPAAPIEPELLRPALRGRDLRPFRPEPRRHLLWAHDRAGRPLERLPPCARAYVDRHAGRLAARSDARNAKPWAVFRTGGALGAHRVVWSDLSRRITAATLTGPTANVIPLNTCYVVVTASASEAESLAGWLNSGPVRALARLVAAPAAGGFFRHGAATIGGLPMPPSVIGDAGLAALARRAAHGQEVQHELDERAAECLELTAGERATLAGTAPTDDRR